MYYIIINPASKSGRGKKIWAGLEPILRQRHIAYKAILSRGKGHVTRITAKLTAPDRLSEASSPLRLIILGGDGTVNEALQGISDFSKVWLGYIPTGSSNDLARDLALPKEPVLILNKILEGKHIRTLDLGVLIYGDHPLPAGASASCMDPQPGRENPSSPACAPGAGKPAAILHPDTPAHGNRQGSAGHERPAGARYFAVSSGIGFDAAVCREALTSRFKHTLNKIGLGKLTYLSIALKQLIAARSVSCDIRMDNTEGSIHLDRFLFAAFMLHKYEGGGFQFCPMADAADGKLDLCVVGKIPKPVILFALPTAFYGKHYIFPAIRHYAASEITLRASAPLWVHTDGEVDRMSDCITVRCVKQQLRLMM